MALSTQDRMLIEQRITNEKKSVAAAYLLWFFFGLVGIHRFYLGRPGGGFGLIVLSVGGAVLVFSGVSVGVIMWGVASLWLLVDLFLIPFIIQNDSEELRQRLSKSMEGGAHEV